MVESPQTQSEERLEDLNAHLEEELDQIRDHAAWYNQRAERDKRRFFLFRTSALLVSFSLSFVIAIQMGIEGLNAVNIVAVVLSLLLGLLANFEILLDYNRSWVEHRTTELALYRLLREYKREQARIDTAESTEQAIQVANATIDGLRTDYEEIVAESVDSFIEWNEETESLQIGIPNPF